MSCAISGDAGQPLTLHFPAFVPRRDISAPAHTSKVQFMVTAAVCKPGSDEVHEAADFSFEVPYDTDPVAEQFISFPVNIRAGRLG